MARALLKFYDAKRVKQAMKETKSTCCYCGVGCGVVIASERERIIGVRGDPDHPANFGRLCTKGATLHLSARPDLRALHPELRRNRSEPRGRVPWDEALDHAAARFAATVRAHGADSVAFYVSGQLLTEDYYVFNKLAKGLVGTNNVDTNSRLCMSSAASGYKATLGADAPPACYEDIDFAECLLIAGSNTAVAHPVLYRRIRVRRRGERHRHGGALVRKIAREPVAVVPGLEPVHPRHAQQRRAHPSAPCDWTDRQAGGGTLFAYRPAERHGRARGRRHGQ